MAFAKTLALSACFTAAASLSGIAGAQPAQLPSAQTEIVMTQAEEQLYDRVITGKQSKDTTVDTLRDIIGDREINTPHGLLSRDDVNYLHKARNSFNMYSRTAERSDVSAETARLYMDVMVSIDRISKESRTGAAEANKSALFYIVGGFTALLTTGGLILGTAAATRRHWDRNYNQKIRFGPDL